MTAEKICERQGDLTGQNGPVQIIGYNYGINGTFCSLIALGKQNNQIVGKIQLASLKLNKSQSIKGYYCDFGSCKVHDDFSVSELFAFSDKNGDEGQLTISELSPPPQGFSKYKKVIPITYPDGHSNDFPIFLQFQNELGLIFIATKQGLLFVFEVSQGSLLLRSKISQGHLLTGCSLEKSKGIMMVGK